MIKTIWVFLFLFSHSVSAQTLSIDEPSEILIPEENQSISETSINYGKDSSLITKASSLNGKIELGGLLLLKASASALVEFEQQILNNNLMWLLQVGGGAFISHGSNSIDGLANRPIPYASAHTGFRYQFNSGFTSSLVLGIRTFEPALWGMISLGWDIKNTIHVEMGLASIYIWPIALIFSIGIPLKRW